MTDADGQLNLSRGLPRGSVNVPARPASGWPRRHFNLHTYLIGHLGHKS
jgi:hypothetical protein